MSIIKAEEEKKFEEEIADLNVCRGGDLEILLVRSNKEI
jgi:hypothetical protein